MTGENEFWETDEMNEFYNVLSACDCLNHKELTDIWCSAEDKEDLAHGISAQFEDAFREMQHIQENYRKLFKTHIKLPFEYDLIRWIKFYANQYKDVYVRTKETESEWLKEWNKTRLEKYKGYINVLGYTLRRMRR